MSRRAPRPLLPGAWDPDDFFADAVGAAPAGGGDPDLGPPASRAIPSRAPAWQQHLAGLRQALEERDGSAGAPWPAARQVVYLVDGPATVQNQELSLELWCRDRRRDGGFAKAKLLKIRRTALGAVPDPDDRRILALLAGARDAYGSWTAHPGSYYDALPNRYRLPGAILEALVPLVCATGRCWLRASHGDGEPTVLAWDGAGAWEFRVEVRRPRPDAPYEVTGALWRDGARAALSEPALLLAGGLVFWRDRVARLDDAGTFPWIAHLRRHGAFQVPARQGDDLLAALLTLPRVPRLELPEELRYEESQAPPRPRLHVRAGPRHWGPDRLRAELAFDYDGVVVAADAPGGGVFRTAPRRFVARDRVRERGAAARLAQVGFHPRALYPGYGPPTELELPARQLPRAVAALVAEGWHVEAEGRRYRAAGAIRAEVASGVDWLELRGHAEFEDVAVPLPDLLLALRRGDGTVRLGDGSYGLLPEEWLRQYGLLARLGTREGDHVRFARTQVGVLDALLTAQPTVTWDAAARRAREELRGFQGIAPLEAPPEFAGQLRGYQRDGLGWLAFLQRFGFGGCLADDMGLGKTVQVLALLESRRQRRDSPAGGEAPPRPSLVVVPRSLVFNWRMEAARFTPKLRLLDHTGGARARGVDHFPDHDVVLTTYGTLRRDVARLAETRFDYVILDEAQAIKNAATESAKAARLLRGDHRLALTGTPVENHLGELWSLFEFLNPGMLGAVSALDLDGAARGPTPEARALLSRAVRPFVLRRTKEQVARDLPPKTEQTLYCELAPLQRAQYDELRAYYRDALRRRVARDGLGRSKIQILEALLRLRQAACHPGLVDRTRAGEPSAKLDVLLPRLGEVADGGHKALVFSQFTSLLGILRARLDAEGVAYEYLDGRTRDRAARVERFQRDSACRLFLVSLKAGGLGLNLTAAEYVFLLDPWWNPAAESQAIDRAHRIGQERPVFAYRLIARDTVEERVLELQATKRALADAIIAADAGLIRALTREDLELLLS